MAIHNNKQWLINYQSSSQPLAALNRAACPEPDPASASVAITTINSANPLPSLVGDNISDPIGISAVRMAFATSSPTWLKRTMDKSYTTILTWLLDVISKFDTLHVVNSTYLLSFTIYVVRLCRRSRFSCTFPPSSRLCFGPIIILLNQFWRTELSTSASRDSEEHRAAYVLSLGFFSADVKGQKMRMHQPLKLF